MVDLGGYVIILVETQDKRVKLYGKFNMQRNIAEWFFPYIICRDTNLQNILYTRFKCCT